MEYDYIKGYKSSISNMPKEIKKYVIEKFIEQYGIEELDNIDKYMLDVEMYVSVDLKNSWRR